MRYTGRESVWVGTLMVLLAASSLSAATPAATRLKARLLTPVSSYYSKSGDAVKALVVPPACSEPLHAFPQGTVLYGVLGKVHRVGLGLLHETAGMHVEFSEMRFPDGESHEIDAQLVSIDNARERVDRKGGIHGIRSTNSISSRIGARIAFEAFEHPLFIAPTLLIESEVFRFPDPEIEYDRGTELNLDVVLPESVPPPACAPAEELDASSDSPDAASRLVAGLPYWSYSKRQPQPMDRVNLVFVGTRLQIEQAFTAAGWNGSRPNSLRAGLNVVRALAEEREDSTAPMRTLLLNGDEPDFSLQTTLNTFEKRDHLRVWKQPDDLDGRPVWASSATRDLGTTFSMGHPFGFTHEIQTNVDRERDKVVRDLQLTGCVESVEYIRRGPDTSPESRKGIYTDSRVAVISFQSCDDPTEDFSDPSHEPPPPRGVQIVRRLTLTTRNHFLRDNIIWRSADATRIGIQMIRHWYVRRNERQLAAASRATVVH